MLISSIVGNGTTVGSWGYQPWLPFYNFVPLILLVSVIVTLALYLDTRFSVERAILWGAVYLTSGLFAIAPVFVLWVKLDLDPSQVLFWWAVNWILIMSGQAYLIRISERVKEQVKAMEDREI